MGHGEGLQADEGEAVGHQQQAREDQRHPALVEAMLDVVRRTTHIEAVAVGALVDLRQGALEEAAGHADQGGHPHPEHRAGATQGHGQAHAGDVAGTHAAGQAEHQRLEGAQAVTAVAQGFLEHGEHVPEMADLHEPRAQGEIAAQADDQHDEHMAGQEVVEHF
ncbi:hypothetical protein Q3H58_003047 [Pseudomonas psychrotolerans]|nr:hypothetical protein [Pseudomonas psychrotolerans]